MVRPMRESTLTIMGLLKYSITMSGKDGMDGSLICVVVNVFVQEE